MEEAELLSTRIGIISKGELRCIGNQQRLKNKFGDGYRLKISFKPANEAETVSLITKYFPTATLSAQFRGTYSYNYHTKLWIFTLLLSRHTRISLGQIGLHRRSIRYYGAT